MSENIDCYDLCRTSTNFIQKCMVLKLYFKIKKKKVE